jgi:hypothetical protein
MLGETRKEIQMYLVLAPYERRIEEICHLFKEERADWVPFDTHKGRHVLTLRVHTFWTTVYTLFGMIVE